MARGDSADDRGREGVIEISARDLATEEEIENFPTETDEVEGKI